MNLGKTDKRLRYLACMHNGDERTAGGAWKVGGPFSGFACLGYVCSADQANNSVQAVEVGRDRGVATVANSGGDFS